MVYDDDDDAYGEYDDDGGEYDEWDEGEFDSSPTTLPCPECGAEIYDDAVRCPSCGWYVIWDEPVGGRSDRWDRLVRLGLILVVLGVLGSVVLPLLMRVWG